MLHRCIEGERVGDDGGEVVGVDRYRDDGPDGVPAPPGERWREPHFFFFLDLPPRWEEGFPSGPCLHGGGGAGAPPRLDLSLCFLLFLCSQILAFHRFLNSRRSVTPIGLKFNTIFIRILSFLWRKKGTNRLTGDPQALQARPG